MKIVYIAEKEELQSLIRECIRIEMEAFMKENNKSPLPDRLNVVEAANYFNVSKATIYKMTMKREIPYHKFGKRIFFYREEIDQWLKDHAKHYKTMEDAVIEHMNSLKSRKRR